MQVHVMLSDGKTAAEAGTFNVEAKTVSAGKRLAREELSKRFAIRSINAKVGGGLVAYVSEPEPPPKIKQPGKPVRHDGPVGRGREMPRKGKGSRR